MAQIISTQIEINRSPADVREIFLSFPKIQEWHQGVFTITRLSPEKPTIEEGERLQVTFHGRRMTTSVLVNSSMEFRWEGLALFGLVKGQHSFRFEASKTGPNVTIFTQEEEFDGPLAFLQGPASPVRNTVQEAFRRFNRDLKARAESAS
ncbi:uncharacterized protein FTOL_09147 [Fusarium torulosum]|uniref:Polyketide cyclase n=1 Tax=Fusarium torulosum TaxID=33205 RepID=A0AAE8SL45_9HYPO|nr:uncharacterized protein FTOL_09147 [Fusarium torulosum]